MLAIGRTPNHGSPRSCARLTFLSASRESKQSRSQRCGRCHKHGTIEIVSVVVPPLGMGCTHTLAQKPCGPSPKPRTASTDFTTGRSGRIEPDTYCILLQLQTRRHDGGLEALLTKIRGLFARRPALGRLKPSRCAHPPAGAVGREVCP